MNWAMKNAKIFPDMVVQMVAIGEESGSLDGMLAKVATIYEQEVDDAVDSEEIRQKDAKQPEGGPGGRFLAVQSATESKRPATLRRKAD